MEMIFATLCFITVLQSRLSLAFSGLGPQRIFVEVLQNHRIFGPTRIIKPNS